ncbi:MAG TPA: Ig-like domain-containing protein, partial [Methylomirabilota bacterium]|nr:Ig-like domain-containing protein [Methylomirabilota bacterium]
TRPAATRTPTATPTPTPTHTPTATATPRPLSIALTAPSELGCDGRQRATVVATVTDEEGEPVEGVRVTFAVSGPGAVAPASATTARDGTASTVLRATGAPNEVVTVKASAANARSADIGVTCQAVVE